MAQSSDSEMAPDILTIVNRSKEYKISKQLICSKIPYFDKMCSSNLKESIDGKVVLDLDDKAFESLIHWVKSDVIGLNTTNVIRLYECADYLLIDKMRDTCWDFFWKIFDMGYNWLICLDGASKSSSLLSQQLFSFLSRSFNIISASPTFIELPFEVIHYLCKVDAPVKSEREIFDTFKRWIDNKKNNATDYQRDLLMKTIRWPYVSSDELTYIKDGYKSLGGNDEDFSRISNCKSIDLDDRRAEDHLIAIFSVADDEIKLLYLYDQVWISLGVYKLDDNLSIGLYSDHKYKTDIIYGSGRNGIRIDWLNKKYRYLEIIGSPSPYYKQLFRSLVFLKKTESRLDNINLNGYYPRYHASSKALFNYNGKFSRLASDILMDWEPTYKTLQNVNLENSASLAARNSSTVFVITKNEPNTLRIFKLNYINFETESIVGKNVFEDLDLTCHDEQIYVTNKVSKEIFIYEPKNFQFILVHRIFFKSKLTNVVSASIPKAFLSK